MMRAEKIASDVSDAEEVLSGQTSPLPPLASLLRRLQRKAADVPGLLDDIIKSLDDALISLDAAQSAVTVALRATEFDARKLEQVEERLFALRAAARKFAVPVDDLARLRDTMVADLADLDAGEERLAVLEKQAKAAREAYDKIAANLSLLREIAARGLETAVMKELPALKLERAEFIVELSSDPENRLAEGVDTVEFWVRTNPGTRAGPMMKVASGGELSRFLLALKVALADRGSAPTLVFDEIDAGVAARSPMRSGSACRGWLDGCRFCRSRHAPQVAARAATHFLIAKSGGTDRAVTSVSRMDDSARLEEVARMLSGESVTDEARRAAERLLSARV